jgi:hypothetical protein
VVEAALRRWVLPAAAYVGLDTLWMLFRNIASWPLMLLNPPGEDLEIGLPMAERVGIGSSNCPGGPSGEFKLP